MLASSLSDRWMEAVHKVSLLEVLQAKASKNKRPLWSPLISIPESGTLVEALRLMQRHSLTALPVFAYGGSLHDPQQPLSQIYKGILNISDILGLTVFQRVFEDVEYSELVDESTSLERFSRVTQQEEVLARTPVSDILGISAESARSHNQVFSVQDSLWTLLQALVRDHRALITDPQDPSHVGMLTQTDLLSFIMENAHLKEDLGPLLAAEAKEIAERAFQRRGPSAIESDPNQSVTARRDHFVLSVPEDMQTLAAFKVMYIHRVSALAVVSSHKKLVESLSATDLSKISLDRLQDLLLSVSEYLAKMKGSQKSHLITCAPESPLEGIVQKALSAHVHRIWVVDDQGRPMGMVSFSDLLALMTV